MSEETEFRAEEMDDDEEMDNNSLPLDASREELEEEGENGEEEMEDEYETQNDEFLDYNYPDDEEGSLPFSDDEWGALNEQQESMLEEGWTLEESSPEEITTLFDNRSLLEDDNDDEDLELVEADELVVEKSSSVAFLDEYMNIDEYPAVERMDRETEADVIDPLSPYMAEEDEELDEEKKFESSTEPRMNRCPSIESYFHQGAAPVVQLYLFPGYKMISRECRLDTTIIQLKMAVARYARVPPRHLDIRRKRNLISDEKTLAGIGVKAGQKIKFTVEINKRLPGSYEIKMPRDMINGEPLPDVHRQVTVELDDGTTRTVEVTIVYATDMKPMLGGFFDQRNNKTYHHAATSIEREPAPIRTEQISIGVQAHGTQTSQMQTYADVGQQMERSGLYISDTGDNVLKARPYTSFDTLEERRQKAAITIQRYWRRVLAKKERKRREEALIKRVRWAEKLRMGRIEQRLKIIEKEKEKQENPRHPLDLELLYRAINLWRKEEEEWVNQNRWGAERKAALATLAEMESDLLLQLERVKNRINVQERENRIQTLFKRMGEPRRWLSEKSKNFITADDGDKGHVRQLHAIYTQLQAPVGKDSEAVKARCALLGKLNDMTKNINTKMSQMLTELVTRELNFLSASQPSSALLAGVRKRISSALFFLCQDPNFNPESKRVQKVPYDPVRLKKDMVQCKGCRRLLLKDEFTIIKGTTVTSRCTTCTNLYRTAILRVDLNLYRHMLKELRHEELAAGVVNSVTFLIDAFDLQFLVDQIWHGQSALSGIDNRYLLRLCRWDRDKPWAPWNCVLLTDEEATAHLQLEHLEDGYTETFFHKVFVMQCTAKTYFQGISKLMVNLDERVRETCDAAQSRAKKVSEVRQKIAKKARMIALIS